jgi:hypothetical protein
MSDDRHVPIIGAGTRVARPVHQTLSETLNWASFTTKTVTAQQGA